MLITAAKPLPSSIRLGADIAYIPRFYRLVDLGHKKDGEKILKAWGRRVFNILELPQWSAMLEASQSQPTSIRRDRLARYMAGRWAMKEAAIKAHTHRQLFPRDISILPQNYETTGNKKPGERRTKPCVLIDPPRRLVLLSELVARQRGLKADIKTVSEKWNIHREGLQGHNSWPKMYERWSRINMEDRQLADGSLSHDQDYVFAVCQALDTAALESVPLVDEGFGDPIHEPLDGDEAYSHA